jgi:hypothetical protein
MDITIQNVHESGYVYIGGEEVSASDYGFRIMPNHSWSIELPSRDSLYAISSVNGSKIAVLKTGLDTGN